MAGPRHKITFEMLNHARRMGWSMSQTGRYYGTYHTTIGDACKRLGVDLPRNQHTAQQPCEDKQTMIAEASDVRVKAWSCKPAAIARALARGAKQ